MVNSPSGSQGIVRVQRTSLAAPRDSSQLVRMEIGRYSLQQGPRAPSLLSLLSGGLTDWCSWL